ncbi:MAG TPA: type II secretion system protein [Gammaproteobacteria bacterium]|nr:type II secretion system protein [Gammaproteobacteria bacterium]
MAGEDTKTLFVPSFRRRPESSGLGWHLDSGLRRNDESKKYGAHVKKTKGFTLIELVTVIVLLGIIAGILTPFIAKAMQAYTHSKARAMLVAKGRLALERLAREIHQAVPNSLSVLAGGTGIEFVRSRTGGRYVARFDDFGSEFSRINRRFRKNANLSALYVVGTGLSLAANDVLVIGNTSPADLQAGNTSAALTGISATTMGADGTTNGQILSFASQQFSVESPGKHFSIADQTVEVGQTGDVLRWFSSAGLTDYDGAVDWSSADPALVDGVSTVGFTYSPGTPQSSGVLRVDLQLADAATGQAIRLYREIHVRNTP